MAGPQLGFPGRGDGIFLSRGTKRQKSFHCSGTMGQKSLHCPGTKGPWDKLKILPGHGTGRAGTTCQNPGRDLRQDNHYFSVKIQDGTQDWTITIFFPVISCFRTSFSCFRTSFPVLEHPFPVLEHPFLVLERPLRTAYSDLEIENPKNC